MKTVLLITAYNFLIGEKPVPHVQAMGAEHLPTSSQVEIVIRTAQLDEDALYWIQNPGESIRAYRPSSRSDPNYSARGEDPESQQAILIKVVQNVSSVACS
jgi:hypothetical protein